MAARPDSDTSWGTRPSDLRPSSTSSAAAGRGGGFDNRPSFLSHPASFISRSFDEDERKPLPAPSSSSSSSNLRGIRSLAVPPVRQEPKPDNYPPGGSSSARPVSNTVTSSNSQPYRSRRNAWGVREEEEEEEEADPAAEMTQASAIDKVSFGMRQSRNPTQFLPHVLCSPKNDGGVSHSLGAEGGNQQHSVAKPLGRPGSDGGGQAEGKGHTETLGNANNGKARLADANTAKLNERPAERPRLNLKPRTKPIEQSEGDLRRERYSLFGDARPRELVLKERGIDDISINNLDLNPLCKRVNSSKNEIASASPVTRSERDNESKDPKMSQEKANVNKRSWLNEKWKSPRDAKDQGSESENWRKLAEKPMLPSPVAMVSSHGESVSNLERSQAFPKSIFNQNSTGQNNQASLSQVTGTRKLHSALASKHQTNGYLVLQTESDE